MSKKVLVAGGVVLLALVVLVGVLVWPRGSSPISEQEAIESFREQGGGSSASSSTVPDEGAAEAVEQTPAPGVYEYRGSGSETVQLGPIPAETREFPGEINGVVTAADPVDDQPCFEVALNLISQHVEHSTYCRTAEGGLRLERYEKHQKVSAFEPTVDIRCDPGVLWEPGEDEAPLSCSLELLGGPKKVSVDLSGTATATEGGKQELESVQGTPAIERGVVTVKLHFDVEGSINGTWDETLRFTTDDVVLVGVERHFDLKGFASFLEDFDYQIASAVPAT